MKIEEAILYCLATRNGGMRKRVISQLSGLYDVSVVVDPAYTQTSVDARSFEAPEEPKPEPKKERRDVVPSAELLELRQALRKIEIER